MEIPSFDVNHETDPGRTADRKTGGTNGEEKKKIPGAGCGFRRLDSFRRMRGRRQILHISVITS